MVFIYTNIIETLLMNKTILAIFIGMIVGFMGGFQGIAGGFYISALLLALGVVDTQRQAAGTTLLAIVFPLSIGAVYEYYKSGDIDIYVGLVIAFFYMIFAWVGAKSTAYVSEELNVLSLAVLLTCTSLYFFYKYRLLRLKQK